MGYDFPSPGNYIISKIFFVFSLDKKSLVIYIGDRVEEKGVCTYGRKFYGSVTVSEKGQIALPKEVREILDIKQGDKLLVIVRGDKKGLLLIKAEVMDEFFANINEGS